MRILNSLDIVDVCYCLLMVVTCIGFGSWKLWDDRSFKKIDYPRNTIILLLRITKGFGSRHRSQRSRHAIDSFARQCQLLQYHRTRSILLVTNNNCELLKQIRSHSTNSKARTVSVAMHERTNRCWVRAVRFSVRCSCAVTAAYPLQWRPHQILTLLVAHLFIFVII